MLDFILSVGGIVIIIGLIVLVLGTILIVKSVSMYKQSEKDKKYDKMLEQPLEKFGDKDKADELAKKYETDK